MMARNISDMTKRKASTWDHLLVDWKSDFSTLPVWRSFYGNNSWVISVNIDASYLFVTWGVKVDSNDYVFYLN